MAGNDITASGSAPTEPRPGWALIHGYIPVELKYLILYHQRTARYNSFSMTLRRLLETHPALAQEAARLYTEAVRSEPGSHSERDM